MNKFLIKATYMDGNHIGETYYLKKGGYVSTRPEHEFYDEYYTSLRCAKSAATKMNKNNEFEVATFHIGPKMLYEAVEID